MPAAHGAGPQPLLAAAQCSRRHCLHAAWHALGVKQCPACHCAASEHRALPQQSCCPGSSSPSCPQDTCCAWSAFHGGLRATWCCSCTACWTRGSPGWRRCARRGVVHARRAGHGAHLGGAGARRPARVWGVVVQRNRALRMAGCMCSRPDDCCGFVGKDGRAAPGGAGGGGGGAAHNPPLSPPPREEK
jgi:hypothetical protein